MDCSDLALLLRLKARRMTRMKLWLDDYLACVAWVGSPFENMLLVADVCTHLFRATIPSPSFTRADSIREKSRFLLWVTELLYAGSIAASKLAILSFYWRVFRYTSIRIPILVLIAAVSIWFTIRTFMVIFHCVPVQAYWDKTITRGRCLVNASTFFFCTILMRCLMDCIIFVLSVIEVAKMHLPWSKKLAVVGLFTVCIASVFILIQAIHYGPDTREFPKEIALSMIWGGVEINVAVFSACLPMLRPIFQMFIPGISTAETSRPISLPSVVLSPTPSRVNEAKQEKSRRSVAHGFVDHELPTVLRVPSNASGPESPHHARNSVEG
ncbi:uncharacterized protein NECHADRAFT_52316 [Fusarium vanettenii 77-13-4]|uniref:Rhodopsin domain-containing protein n=1 Tax=Fusarium vanettenii (strain ATCC MYA-4622 / CBS 123669 / FGSC 9596 / NRRL 45880 / 77-13-4) TaxID=660122 RepID=C7ZG67_FUSV7|nr:uncharacterized protein NECHADRAFT_52316 [Fusarium vanettenii 77-13-4]EEU37111.1 hypothetical protein NECHADRAFT_52316 [Fusarium vanettenii 77-13-4]